jgi:anti-anti-sigma factor
MGAVRSDLASIGDDEFRLDRVRLDGIRIVAVHGDCDLDSARELRNALTAELEGDDGSGLVIDLSGATVFDSTSLGVIVLALKASRASGRALGIVASTPVVRLGFEVAGLDRLVPLFETRGDAILATRRPSDDDRA